MFKRTKVSAAAALVLSGLAAVTAQPAVAQEAQRIEITGSSIKRVQAEGATPVITVNRAEIERIGAASVGELLRSVATMTADDDSSFGLQPTLSGFQGAAMSGFDNGDTLVLVNGRRISKYPVGGSEVDVNSLPLLAIDRIEILKDGASAIYGTDAIAGVINIITKKEFSGGALALSFGTSQKRDGEKNRFGVMGGFGDLEKQGFNLVGALEIGSSGRIFNRDRKFAASADLRPFGLSDDRLPTAPDVNVQFDDDETWQPASTCSAPLPPGGIEVPNITDPAGGLVCPFDPNKNTLLQPAVKDIGAFAQIHLKLGNVLSRSEFLFKEKKSGNFLNPQPVGLALAGTDPSNVTGRDLTWFWRSTDPRLFRNKDIKVSSFRLMSELSGSVGAYDWTVDGGRAESDYLETGSGYFLRSALNSLLASGVLNPFDKNSFSPDVLLPATRSPVRTATTGTTFVNAKVSGPLTKLSGGDLLFAAGGGYAKDSYQNSPDPLQIAGLLLGDPQLSLTSGTRNNKFVFGEVIAPITKQIEVGAAVRYDNWNTFGGTTNPKLNIRFQPSTAFLVRASAGTGFKAPELEDMFASPSSGFPNVRDTARCERENINPCPRRQVFTQVVSNPDLKPEKSKAFTLGFVVSPFDGLSASVDYLLIKKKDEIDALEAQDILDNPTIAVAGFGTAADLVRRLPSGAIDPSTAVPAITAPTANISTTETRNLAVDLQYSTKIGGFGLKLQNDTSYLLSRKSAGLPGLPLEEYKDLAGYPKWRNVFSATGSVGNWSVTGYVRSIAGFLDTDTPGSVDATTRRIPSWTTMDLGVAYSGLFSKDTTVDFQIKNLTDREPPLSETRNTSNKIDFVHSGVGRYFQVALRTAF
jgi:iron complex outermembrane recepter protein